MKTRRQAAADHSPINRVPVEVLTHILKYKGITRSDVRSVASANRYLRSVATPLLFQEIRFVAKNAACFEPLTYLVGKGHGQALRMLYIGNPRDVAFSHKPEIYTDLIHDALPSLPNLTSFSLPFLLLDDRIFDSVYDHTHIETLGILGSVIPPDRVITLDSSIARPSRSKSLTVTNLTSGRFPHTVELIETFLEFLRVNSVLVPEVKILFNASMAPACLLQIRFPSLRHVHLVAYSGGFSFLSHYFGILVGFGSLRPQPSLKAITLVFVGSGEGFDVGNGEACIAPPASASFRAEWAGVRVQEMQIQVLDPDLWTPSLLKIGFGRGTIVTPRRMETLAREHEMAYFVVFYNHHEDLRWSDWDATIRLLPSSFPILGLFTLHRSTTPIPTVSTTLSCSPTCYGKLARSHPSLHRDAELVGGYASVWRLSFDLNFSRIKRVGPFLDIVHDALREVTWSVQPKEKQVVHLIGTARNEDGSWERWEDRTSGVGVEEKMGRCLCFLCGEVKKGEDPISALRTCGAREVREALAEGGFDLEEFDSRDPTSPVDQGSFETFLRSAV